MGARRAVAIPKDECAAPARPIGSKAAEILQIAGGLADACLESSAVSEGFLERQFTRGTDEIGTAVRFEHGDLGVAFGKGDVGLERSRRNAGHTQIPAACFEPPGRFAETTGNLGLRVETAGQFVPRPPEKIGQCANVLGGRIEIERKFGASPIGTGNIEQPARRNAVRFLRELQFVDLEPATGKARSDTKIVKSAFIPGEILCLDAQRRLGAERHGEIAVENEFEQVQLAAWQGFQIKQAPEAIKLAAESAQRHVCIRAGIRPFRVDTAPESACFECESTGAAEHGGEEFDDNVFVQFGIGKVGDAITPSRHPAQTGKCFGPTAAPKSDFAGAENAGAFFGEKNAGVFE